MTTHSEAAEAIYAAFQTAWLTTGLQYTFDSESFSPPSLAAWARLSVRNTLGTQETLGRVGQRNFSRRGSAIVQVFTPLNQGTAQARSLATVAKNAFEGKTLSGTDVTFRDVTIREIGPDSTWYQINVDAAFEFFETK